VHLVKALFSDAPALFSGRFYNVHELDGWPKPPAAPPNPDDRRRARPRLPRFAAREADIGGFDSGADPFSWSFDALRRQAEIVHEAAGAPPELHLNQTSAAWGGRANEFVDQTARQLGVSPDDLDRSAYVLAGSVHQIVDHLGRLRETVGISYVTSPVDWDDPNLDFARPSTSGVIGNPTTASAALGAQLWAAVVNDVARTLYDLAQA